WRRLPLRGREPGCRPSARRHRQQRRFDVQARGGLGVAGRPVQRVRGGSHRERLHRDRGRPRPGDRWRGSAPAQVSGPRDARRTRGDAIMAPMSASDESGTTHFGYREVPVGEKQKLVGEVFSSVAGNYDLMNDLMSMGIHRLWKRYFVATAQVRRGARVLDLAGGTGDIAALLKDRVGESGELVLGDINGEMLRVGRDRMTDRGDVRGFEYVQCNAEKLPFPDASFDLVTIAFGLRNVTDKDAALREMLRVLQV